MKKALTIAVAIIAMTMVASANVVAWGLNNGETVSFTDGTIYLVQGNLPSTTGWDEKESFSTSDLGGTIIAQGTLDNGFYFGSVAVTSVNGSTGRFPFFVAAISSDGKTVDLSGTTTIQIRNNQNNSFASYDGGGFTTYTAFVPPPTPPIPEPTTVALLAIGLAALGLKRKVA